MAAKKTKKATEPKYTVSDTNITKAAQRLLSQRLVSTETAYIQRVLGNTATQQAIDDQVLAVRKLSWSDISLPD
ncbi:MAG: hypothetical protein ABI779_26885 [Acidobacteriota bacterium]